jgi:hypothetical protein
MTTFAHTTFAQAKALLASRLSDPSEVHWTDSELGQYIREAIRVYNVMSGLHRVAVAFNTSPNVAFYDLSTVVGPATYRAYGQTDVSSLTLMKHMLMEVGLNINTGAGITEMWLWTDWIDALQKARDQFIVDTGCVLTARPIIATADDDTFDLLIPSPQCAVPCGLTPMAPTTHCGQATNRCWSQRTSPPACPHRTRSSPSPS